MVVVAGSVVVVLVVVVLVELVVVGAGVVDDFEDAEFVEVVVVGSPALLAAQAERTSDATTN